MKNDKLKSVIVLTVICLIVTALLALTNSVTAPIIEKTRERKVQDSLKTVLPNADSFKEVELPDDAPDTIKSAFISDDGSYAIVLATRSAYSSGDMGITVGVDPDGNIAGITLTSYQESKDFGKDTYPLNYIGKNMSDYSDVDSFAGVTYSSKALKNAIGDALSLIDTLKGGAA